MGEIRTDITCEVCKDPITVENSVIRIIHSDIDAYQEAKTVWNDENSEVIAGDHVTAMRGFPHYPQRARWRVEHLDCSADEVEYWFLVSECDTYQKALAWTLHLMEKTWLKHTNWDGFIEWLFPGVHSFKRSTM